MSEKGKERVPSKYSGLYGIKTIDDKGTIGFGVTPDSAIPYLRKELGQEFYDIRSTAIAKSLHNPQEFLEKRQDALAEGMKKVGTEYATAFESFAEAGFGEEACKVNAMAHAKATWHNQKALVDLKYPESIEDGLLKANTDGKIGVREIWGASRSNTPVHPKADKKKAKATKK